MPFKDTLPPDLRALVDQAMAVEAARPDTPALARRVIDHTSLYGRETAGDIAALCAAAVKGGVAAVCVYPADVARSRAALAGTEVLVATVNNFPHGEGDAAQAVSEAEKTIAAGAQEVDTVLDYAAFLAGREAEAAEKLKAVAALCRAQGVTLKIILKASVHPTAESLARATRLAIECGADFVKTCTGKTPLPGFGTGDADVSTLYTAAVMMQAAALSGVGVKISGGVKTALEAERMRVLSDALLGPARFGDPKLFRFGASALLGALRLRTY